MTRDPLSMLVQRASDKPIYLTSPLFVEPQFTDHVIDLLRDEHPAAIFVNSRGRYRSVEDWRQRWAAEHRNYGAAILLTVGEPTDDDPELEGDGIRGAHVIDRSVWQEARDLVQMSRPLLWVPYWRSQLRYVARFVVESPEDGVSRDHFGVVYPAVDAAPLRPEIANPICRFFVVRRIGDGSQ